jgi:biofilm protein TabA
MIADTLTQCRRYTSLSPRFAAAFEFLENLPADQPPGRHDIDGDNCFALVQTYQSKPLAEAKFEAHRQYIDIQFIQTGSESILWAPLAALTQVTEPYAAGRDIAFFANPTHWTPINLAAGQFTILFPEDGHAPGVECSGPAEVRKVVIKVRAA